MNTTQQDTYLELLMSVSAWPSELEAGVSLPGTSPLPIVHVWRVME